ncbi:MAG: (Fe-S)-binding protein [Promethearchaeati archaeon]
MDERIEGRKNYPTKEVDPKNFIDDDEIREMVKQLDSIEFSEDDYYKVYNCVDCGECDTEEDRIRLKQKYVEQGHIIEDLKNMRQCFEKYRTPYPMNEMRMKIPEGIPEESDTLFFMGCLSTMKIPRYTQHALEYLLHRDIDFTILDEEICCGWPWYVSGSNEELEVCMKENIEIFKNYQKIICLCPACYYLFQNNYCKEMDKDVKISYIVDYLRPAKEKKSGNVAFQHLCQLKFRGEDNIDKFVENIFRKSGYNIIDIPHWCCGHGIGRMHRLDVIDAIGEKRIKDFDQKDIDFVSTYCVSCWWWLYRFSKKFRIHPQARDIFELLM